MKSTMALATLVSLVSFFGAINAMAQGTRSVPYCSWKEGHSIHNGQTAATFSTPQIFRNQDMVNFEISKDELIAYEHWNFQNLLTAYLGCDASYAKPGMDCYVQDQPRYINVFLPAGQAPKGDVTGEVILQVPAGIPETSFVEEIYSCYR